MTDQCATCKFWSVNEQWDDSQEPEMERRGGCHRHAPSPLIGDVAYEILHHLTLLSWEAEHSTDKDFMNWEEAPLSNCSWPITRADDWCGDYAQGQLR